MAVKYIGWTLLLAGVLAMAALIRLGVLETGWTV